MCESCSARQHLVYCGHLNLDVWRECVFYLLHKYFFDQRIIAYYEWNRFRSTTSFHLSLIHSWYECAPSGFNGRSNITICIFGDFCERISAHAPCATREPITYASNTIQLRFKSILAVVGKLSQLQSGSDAPNRKCLVKIRFFDHNVLFRHRTIITYEWNRFTSSRSFDLSHTSKRHKHARKRYTKMDFFDISMFLNYSVAF